MIDKIEAPEPLEHEDFCDVIDDKSIDIPENVGVLTMKELKFLEMYAKTLDEEKSLESCGMTVLGLKQRKMKKQFFTECIQKVQKAWLTKYELCPELISGKLTQTINKLDKFLDEGDVKAGAPMVKALELAMKNQDMLSKADVNTGPKVIFNIDLGSAEKKIKRVKAEDVTEETPIIELDIFK